MITIKPNDIKSEINKISLKNNCSIVLCLFIIIFENF
jgi:hypothetical protein